MSYDLKPCPFCGANVATLTTAKEEEDCKYFESEDCPCFEYNLCRCIAVVCDFSKGGCGASGGYSVDVENAIKKWNRRAEDEE